MIACGRAAIRRVGVLREILYAAETFGGAGRESSCGLACAA
jgi:hypothetical protein